jgi:hypothetical protein
MGYGTRVYNPDNLPTGPWPHEVSVSQHHYLGSLRIASAAAASARMAPVDRTPNSTMLESLTLSYTTWADLILNCTMSYPESEN